MIRHLPVGGRKEGRTGPIKEGIASFTSLRIEIKRKPRGRDLQIISSQCHYFLENKLRFCTIL